MTTLGSIKRMARTTLRTKFWFLGDEKGEARRDTEVSNGARADEEGDEG